MLLQLLIFRTKMNSVFVFEPFWAPPPDNRRTGAKVPKKGAGRLIPLST